MMRWGGTAAYMIGMVLTSLNIFPLNLIFGAIGGALWCVVGIRWKDKALIIVEAASALTWKGWGSNERPNEIISDSVTVTPGQIKVSPILRSSR